MAVTEQHASYKAHLNIWQRVRDVVAGEDAVKRAGQNYLPRLGGQNLSEYHGYLNRALFFGASGRTVQGLLGAIFRKSPMVQVPEHVKDQLDQITADGQSFPLFAKKVTAEILTMGRYGVLVDMAQSDGAVPYMVGYEAEQITQWRTQFVDGRHQLSLVVLGEMVEENGDDPFTANLVPQYRVLSLDEDGFYVQSIWRLGPKGKEFVVVDQVMPTFRGERFNYIPFTFMGPVRLGSDIEKSPILDLVNVNISHYRSSADLEHGRHFTALPTPWMTAPSQERAAQEYKIGPGNVWLLEPGGEAGMLEFKGAGLTYLENACREKERMMTVLGARLLEDQKNGVEAAQTVRLRQNGESGLLAGIADSVGRGLTRCLQYWGAWQGIAPQEISVMLNTDFFGDRLPPEELRELVSAWQAGAIDKDQLTQNLTKGEIV